MSVGLLEHNYLDGTQGAQMNVMLICAGPQSEVNTEAAQDFLSPHIGRHNTLEQLPVRNGRYTKVDYQCNAG